MYIYIYTYTRVVLIYTNQNIIIIIIILTSIRTVYFTREVLRLGIKNITLNCGLAQGLCFRNACVRAFACRTSGGCTSLLLYTPRNTARSRRELTGCWLQSFACTCPHRILLVRESSFFLNRLFWVEKKTSRETIRIRPIK